MPIFQDDDDDLDTGFNFEQARQNGLEKLRQVAVADSAPEPLTVPAHRLHRLSEESLRTELCEGPLLDSPPRVSTPPNDIPTVSTTSDRVDLIERLKHGQSPTWIPSRQLQSALRDTLPETPSKRMTSSSSATSPLLPAAEITPERLLAQPSSVDARLKDGMEIERPRSALHSGDFTSEDSDSQRGESSSQSRFNKPTLGPDSWLATSPPRNFTPFIYERRIPLSESGPSSRSAVSPLSSSISSSFVYQPPTSPLVQSESNDAPVLSGTASSIDQPFQRLGGRRHTFNSEPSSPFDSPPSRHSMSSRHLPPRRENTFPYQAHQPRRSLTSTPSFLQHGASPGTPASWRSRRQSFGSDSSPLQHASMVGSYEESILRGRMSTTPSKPLDFLAQIGVLGRGNCKSNLRCPPHVTLPFSAVFYSYSSTSHGRSPSNDGPSPYVGQVDLENGLPNPEEEARLKRKAQSRLDERRVPAAIRDDAMSINDGERDSTRSARSKRSSASPRAPPGGSYRIPEKGQIQIIIKNQNKTAVKLFLVPYDLTGMPPGTKTFIRQRSYSAGPIMDNIPQVLGGDPADRPILRYLVHLHVCCPAKGRFYLYKSIRVVFANRVPDGKEKLQNETTWPDPRYTAYKPIRVMHPPLVASGGGAGATLVAEKAYRRRSLGISYGPQCRNFDAVDGFYSGTSGARAHSSTEHNTSRRFGSGGSVGSVDPIPFYFTPRHRLDSNPSELPADLGFMSPSNSQLSRPSTNESSATGSDSANVTMYEKLSKGDFGYGGSAFASVGNWSSPGAEGLLSQRLRSLGVETDAPEDLQPGNHSRPGQLDD